MTEEQKNKTITPPKTNQ